MADLLAAGKAVLDTFIASLPEDQRVSATELFSKPEAQEAVKKIGDAAMMRADYSRQTQEVAQEKARAEQLSTAAAEHKARLDKWYADAEPLMSLGRRAKESGWTPDDAPLQTPKPAELPADLVRREDLDNREQLAVRYMNAAVGLGLKHLQTFGETLDMDELISDPRVPKLGIQGVYDAKYKDRYEEKAKASRDADRAKFEAEIRADERKRSANRPLTPTGIDTSPLDALASPDKKPGSVSVDDMAAAYEAAVAAHPR